jgi:ubiquinone/menaquinone biosynthesis C-methylase UbiE
MTETRYVHGTEPEEQKRLARLNDLLNRRSLAAMRLTGGERVLDVGSGLGQMSRAMSRAVGPSGRVVGVERSAEQIERGRELSHEAREEWLADIRQGDATALPLRDEEWGTFDVAHARFLLEHVPDPLAVVRGMVRAVRPGGRIVLEDDDHDVFRIWPEAPPAWAVWKAYLVTYERLGLDPNIGRRLVEILHQAGVAPMRNDWLFFGSCPGDPDFSAYVDNLAAILVGARADIVATGLVDEAGHARGIAELREWQKRPGASLWYAAAWAEGRKPVT